MFRRLLAFLAIALLAASCSSSDTLATVNGVEITKAELFELHPDYEEAAEINVTGEQLRQAVSDLILFEASVQAAEDEFDVVITDSDIADRVANPPDRWAAMLAGDATVEGGAAIQRQRAVVSLLVDRVGPILFAEEYGGWESLLAERPDYVTRACIRYIYVETEEAADGALARVLAGEDFAALVEELSLDQSSPDGVLVGTDGSCLISFATLDEGLADFTATADLEVPDILPLGAGYGVVQVEQRVQPESADQLAVDPLQYLDFAAVNSLYSAWVSDTVRGADVEVSPVLGRWSSVGFGIAAPGE